MSAIPEPIAIIGTGCRFPGDSHTSSKLWSLLRDPKDLLTTIPDDRFSMDGFYHEDGQYHGHGNAKYAYLLAGEGTCKRFDARFFGMNPGEANVLDPQIRLLLETVYEALEEAGQTIEGLQGSDTAVYAGTMLSEYERLMLRDEQTLGMYHGTGTARSLVSNRVSYFFDWHGPSMTIDTACSSSLIAVHQAAQQLRSGQSRVAIAAGANLILDPQSFISFSKLKMLSPEGRSRMWDADVKGYARGEGIAVVVLKKLSAALKDGDHIECIIREVGVNQDGKTPGLTMPSASAQASLIRACYSRAGLDLTNPENRPQYFEAHGTGTPAGDPVEAEAIHTAFFPGRTSAKKYHRSKLYVGSIKTIIGHTEGTAGLAALLKGSLALQNETIPPNLLFNRLNPEIERFYGNLEVPTSPIPWPETSNTRRVSVNSFGFGGTNAHAILESYKTPKKQIIESQLSTVFSPFVFSAASELSLTSYLRAFLDYLREPNASTLNLRNLAYTLHSRRSHLQISTTIAASSLTELQSKLEEKLEHVGTSGKQELGTRSMLQSADTRKPLILGIFTGQGAQWAQMGAELIQKSDTARRLIETLDKRLSQLPAESRPSWSLLEELQKDDSCSRIGQAEFSQPLCTAVQILQVDMLYAAGIEFTAVVGHSSGEIVAAYAAGFISAEDAICIAYYRGLYSYLAEGKKGEKGSMMAVESTIEDIQELCDSRHFKGRIGIAAINSPSSLTVSGDKDAVERLQVMLQDENKFARVLKVDKAYHSHHMLACSQKYLDALLALDIKVGAGGECSWFSSVEQGKEGKDVLESLQGPYWNENLVNPVLFMQALRSAWLSKGSFDLAIEVGPHPALRSPAMQSIKQVSAHQIPYIGLLRRGKNSIETVADGLGFVWANLGRNHVNMQAYDVFMCGASAPPCRIVKGLPPYSWDHENEYWHESRYARAERSRSAPVHQLLGHITPDSTEENTRWRNILRPKEIPWTKGHRLQQQVVFPAAGYVVLALEASLQICNGAPISLIEVLDVEIGKALTFDDDDGNVEAVFSLTNISRRGIKVIEANFTYNAAEKSSDSLTLRASGRVRILLGEYLTTALPPRSSQPPGLLKVKAEDFYGSLEDMNYEYSGPFKALTNLQRRLGYSTGYISNLEATTMILHPAILDAAFQSTFLARSVPYDGGIWALHVPKTIRSVRINPVLCASETAKGGTLLFDSVQPVNSSKFEGDVDIYSTDLEHSMVQVQGLSCVPFAAQSAADDKEPFSTTVWGVEKPDAERVARDFVVTKDQRALSYLLERVSIFYFRNLDANVPIDHPARLNGSLSPLFKYASHCISLAESGKWSFWKPEWNRDTYQQIALACEPYADVIDIKLLRAIGDDLVAIATGEKQAIEVGMKDNLLAEYYQRSLGTDKYTEFLARIVKQITHRYPHLDVLEIGAGTGGATKSVFQNIGKAYASYTFTDVSSGFFPTAQSVFEAQHGMVFKVLDINKDPCAQGFEEASYDLIVASMVLHATETLETTIRNVRRLLKPGGYLVLLEGLPETNVRYGAIFGAFPGWWAGSSDGRLLSPLLDVTGWDELLRKSGFSGSDTVTPNPEPLIAPLTVIVSQALDDRVALLRDPLSNTHRSFNTRKLVEELVIVEGHSLHISRLASHIEKLTSDHCGRVRRVQSFTDIPTLKISDTATVLSLNDLDTPFFGDLTQASWEALKGTLLRARTLLWVTHSRMSGNPHANMTIGLLRPAHREIPTLDVQFLDFQDSRKVDPRIISETLLRQRAIALWQSEGVHETLLTSFEPEIMIDKKNQASIPRLILSQEMNDRYNSLRRPVFTSANRDNQLTSIVFSEAGYSLRQEPPLASIEKIDCFDVSYSLLSTIRVADSGYMFLMLGQDCKSNDQVLALSCDPVSVFSPWEKFTIPIEIEPGFEADFLSDVTHHILASIIINGLTRGDRVLVFNASPEFDEVITWRARNSGVYVTFITYDTTPTGPNWLNIHPNAADRDIRALLPTDISVFVDFSEPRSDQTGSDKIRSQLPNSCRSESLATLFRMESQIPWTSHIGEIKRRLQDAVNYAHYSLAETEADRIDVTVIGVGALSQDNEELSPQSIIDWTTSAQVPVKVRPIDSGKLFHESKTYWLAGLSHGLGLSLAEWMVRHGAKNIVLSSRRPNIDERWLKKMATAGCSVKVYSCDITNENEVVKTHADICFSMPPIGGVTQGAMVLEDTSISAMTVDQVLKVTRPKVEGSIHLHNLFKKNTLDFFVFFSSASAIIGYSGQANYSAANLFMSGLAEERHQRGLAASVINIGPVLGVGYLSQHDLDMRSHMKAIEGMFSSEQDFHQLFAEAVVAGRPGGPGPIEITTGLARVGLHDAVKPAWTSNSIMSHYIKNDGATVVATSGTKMMNVPIKTKLSKATRRDEVYRVIHEALIVKFSALYQRSVAELAKEDPSNLHLNEMGTDSLMATEIRGWFMKTLQVNIPVLKILSGITVRELLTVATETIPLSWIPGVPVHDVTASAHSAPLANLVPKMQNKESENEYDELDSSVNDEQDPETPENYDTQNVTQPSSVASEADIAHLDDNMKYEEDGSISNTEKISQLSFSQEMFWFVLAFLQDKSSLNHTASFRLAGKIRQEDFEYALQSMGKQHEILRTRFFEKNGQPMQGLLKSSTIRGEYRQIQDEHEVDIVVNELENYCFDIASGETLKAVLLSMTPVTHFLVLCSHSLVVDGLSFRVFLRDLEQHYKKVYSEHETPQYLDYATKQRLDYNAGHYNEELHFWKNEFADFPDPLPIMSLGKVPIRPALTTYNNERADIRLGAQTKSRIQALCRKCGVTPFHFHLTVFAALLVRYTDAEDFSIGIADANRTDEAIMDGIGSFVNLLPLRFRTKGTASFEKLLLETRSKFLAALANSKIPFQVLLNELGAPRSATTTPIFQCFVDYRLGQREKIVWGDCQLEMTSFQASKLAYDIALDIIDDPDGDCLAMLIVRKDLYSQRDAESLVKTYERLVSAFTTYPGASLDEPDIFGPAEINKALDFSHGRSARRMWPETMIHKIDEVFEINAHEPAVKWDGDNMITYSELQSQVDAIVDALVASNVVVGSRVAVLQEPTANWISSILAIMRLGAVYVPLDLGNTWNRLAAMTKDCQPCIVLVDCDTEQNADKLGAAELKVINVSSLNSVSATRLPIAATSNDVATILYTSGSSGTPKGIVLKHEGFRNWLESTAQVYELESEVVLQQSSMGFDMSLIQVFTALCLGGSMYVVPRRLRGDAQAICELVYSQGITYTFTCTSELLTWFKYGSPEFLGRSTWRRAITGGEPGVDALFKEFASLCKPELRMFHAYGPTEISWTATTMELLYSSLKETSHQNIAVGYPLPNYSVYVLDNYMNPVPPGVQGEIFVGGPGVAQGYLNNDAMTAERFVPDVFATPESRRRGWNSLHRTGDLGRWGENGALFIEGRISGDTQVKIRGLRVDLREVEKALIEASQSALSEAVVSVRRLSLDSPQFLAAHVVFDQSHPQDERAQVLDSLKSQLRLPRYMCPSVIVPLEHMPMTNSLKLDRRAIATLPLPEITGLQEDVELTETESQLKSIWEDVISNKIIGLHSIGPATDFFHVGGTSLLLLDLRRRIQNKFRIELSLIDMFNSSTLSGMALMAESKDSQQRTATQINWAQETDLPAELQRLPTVQPVTNSGLKTIVLTGSTGYLGQGILQALLKDPGVDTIHCIAVRNKNRIHRDIADSSKVIIHEGDLILPRLGLSDRDCKGVFDAADAIIHNGADVSYMKSYASLRLPNVQATKELAKMSMHRMIPFHYISSGGACSFAAAAGSTMIGPASVAQFPPPTSGHVGYASSKWASEVFLEKLKKRYANWPVYIHRPSNIARIDTPHLDLVYNIQKYSRLLQAAPVARGKVLGKLDSVTLDTVVQGILRAVMDKTQNNNLQFLHHLGGVELPMNDLRSWVSKQKDSQPTGSAPGMTQDAEIEEIPFDQWNARAAEKGMHPALVAFMQTFAVQGGLIFPNLVK